MPNMIELLSRYNNFVLAILLLITASLYAPGLTGGLHFDDIPSLANLATVTDYDSAVSFVLDGRAGPLGRPLALLSFIWQAEAWPNYPEQFLLVNVGIHLLNVVFVFFLFKQLAKPLKQSSLVVLFSSATWALCPLLASSSLLIVQRMATLSASFALLGLLFYSIARCRKSGLNRTLVLSSILLVFTVLSVFNKENGILLPIYIFIMEVFWFSKYEEVYPKLTKTEYLIKLSLLVSVLVLLGYSVFYWINNSNFSGVREFTVTERFNTQLVILWNYIKLAFFPVASKLGPFHDDYEVQQGILVFLAGVAWLLLIVFAIFFRKKIPILGLALFWYLGAHALESSVFLLELYFEHRNYIALVGPFFSIYVYLFNRERFLKEIFFISVFYLIFQIGILYQHTSGWGNPYLGAVVWAKAHPNSERALQYLTNQYLSNGNYEDARMLIHTAAERNPKSASLLLQSLLMDCAFLSNAELQEREKLLLNKLTKANYSLSAPSALDQILSQIVQEQCKMTPDQLLSISDQLLKNEKYFSSNTMRHALHQVRASIYQYQRLLNPTMLELDAAFVAWPRVETVKMAVDILLSAGLPKEALAWIDRAIQQAPAVQRADWMRQLAEQRAIGLQQLEGSKKLE